MLNHIQVIDHVPHVFRQESLITPPEWMPWLQAESRIRMNSVFLVPPTNPNSKFTSEDPRGSMELLTSDDQGFTVRIEPNSSKRETEELGWSSDGDALFTGQLLRRPLLDPVLFEELVNMMHEEGIAAETPLVDHTTRGKRQLRGEFHQKSRRRKHHEADVHTHIRTDGDDKFSGVTSHTRKSLRSRNPFRAMNYSSAERYEGCSYGLWVESRRNPGSTSSTKHFIRRVDLWPDIDLETLRTAIQAAL